MARIRHSQTVAAHFSDAELTGLARSTTTSTPTRPCRANIKRQLIVDETASTMLNQISRRVASVHTVWTPLCHLGERPVTKHQNLRHYAARPRQSPRTRNRNFREAAPQAAIPSPADLRSVHPDAVKVPPLSHFQEFASLLDVSPEFAHEIAMKTVDSVRSNNYCEVQLASINTFTKIGHVCHLSQVREERVFGEYWLNQAAEQGDAEAVIRMFRKDVLERAKAGRSLGSTTARLRQHLEKVAQTNNVEAMCVLGEFYYLIKEVFRAEKVLESALKLDEERLDAEVQETSSQSEPQWLKLAQKKYDFGQAWYLLGKIKYDKGEEDDALRAFEAAALRNNHPESYYFLCELEDRYSAKWLEYMSKAAASGHILSEDNEAGAAYEMRNFYNQSPEDARKLPDASVREHYFHFHDFHSEMGVSGSAAMAREWNGVFLTSVLNLRNAQALKRGAERMVDALRDAEQFEAATRCSCWKCSLRRWTQQPEKPVSVMNQSFSDLYLLKGSQLRTDNTLTFCTDFCHTS